MKRMRSEVLDSLKSAVRNWWLSVLVGVLFVGLGLWMLFIPVESYVAISVVFSIFMFVIGIFEIAFAVSNTKVLRGWGWTFTGGIIDLIVGMILMAYPGLSMAVIPFILAFWLMFRGFSSVGFAIDMSRYGITNWGWYLIFGILAILCSLMVIWQPAVGGFATVLVISFAFLFVGVARIMIGIELKCFNNRNKELFQ